MIGITLSSEQIRTAPPDVRRWIEREVCSSLGLQSLTANASKPQGTQLAACSVEDVAAVLSQIQGVLPAVNVLFEFGRQGAMVSSAHVEAFRLLDIVQHTRLQNVAQVIACLDIINEALGRIRGDANARFCAFDHDGHCFIAMQTQQSILRVWQDVIADQQLASPGQGAGVSLPPATAGAPLPVIGGVDDAPGQQMPAPVVGENVAVQ